MPLAAAAAPAGGSPIGQVIIATAAATVVLAALIGVGLRRRAGKSVPGLDLWERIAGEVTGLPGWAAVPVSLAAGALICAVFGLYWDESLHMDRGRDEGPLANPSHFFILAGLLGIFAAGWLATVLPKEKPGPVAVRITEGWYAPLGGLMMMACASFAALGFPLDDVWHRLFGQDVTLWGPTHMMMLTGAALTLVGIMVIMAEGRLATRESRPRGFAARYRPSGLVSNRMRLVLACGGLLIGISIYQGEFDYGVPQYRLLFQPALIALAAGGALIAARSLGGRGAALGAALFFILVRGILTIAVGPVLGETVAHFPLFIAEALLVEAIALRVRPDQTPYRFAIAAGALIGTVGVFAEYAWSHVWMPIPWPAHLLPGALAVALPAAIGGAVISAFLACCLRGRKVERTAVYGALASVTVVVGVLTVLTSTTVPAASATVTLTDATPPPERTVHATMKIDPPGAAVDADWLVSIAWQGGGHVETAALKPLGDGVYRTSEPVPVHGTWKSALRLQRGRDLASIPLFLPADPGIPAAEVPAPATFTREFVADHELLQRERKDNATGTMWQLAVIAVMSTILGLMALLGWGLVRLAGTAPRPAPADPNRAASQRAGAKVAA